MGAIRERQKHQLRAEIVRAAFELFGKHGFDKTSVEAICAETGISRATFFNYFPQKELILREIANARVAKLKTILDRFASAGRVPALDDIVKLFLDISRENARLSGNSKRLLLEAAFHAVSRSTFALARGRAIDALTMAIERIPRRKQARARLAAETLFAIYLATTLEWLTRESATPALLLRTMRGRLQLALQGIA
jgi:AcrR family transcriptional regulator